MAGTQNGESFTDSAPESYREINLCRPAGFLPSRRVHWLPTTQNPLRSCSCPWARLFRAGLAVFLRAIECRKGAGDLAASGSLPTLGDAIAAVVADRWLERRVRE